MTYYSRNGIPFLSQTALAEMAEGETLAGVHPLKNQPVTPTKGQEVIHYAKLSPS
jgi:hypothetical protein